MPSERLTKTKSSSTLFSDNPFVYPIFGSQSNGIVHDFMVCVVSHVQTVGCFIVLDCFFIAFNDVFCVVDDVKRLFFSILFIYSNKHWIWKRKDNDLRCFAYVLFSSHSPFFCSVWMEKSFWYFFGLSLPRIIIWAFLGNAFYFWSFLMLSLL